MRAAVIGTGFGTRIHVPGLRLAGAEVVAVSGRRRERVEAVAETEGIPAAYTDYRVMLDETRPDLVCVASPTYQHLEMVREAVQRGIHVWCEKPLAMTGGDAWEMVRLTREAGLLDACNFQMRYLPARAHFRKMIREGYIGDLRILRYIWTGGLRLDPANPGFTWFAERDAGGGVLYNIGSHYLDFLRWTFGDVASVSGSARAFVPERVLPEGGMGTVTADDTMSIDMVLESGALAMAQFSMVTAGRRVQIEAYGSEGTLILEDDRNLLAGKGADLEPVSLPGGGSLDFNDPATLAGLDPEVLQRVRAGWSSGFSKYMDGAKQLIPYVGLARQLLDRIENGGPALHPTLEDGAQVQDIIDAALASADSGRRVAVERGELLAASTGVAH
jgi:predicted dehydrogenase